MSNLVGDNFHSYDQPCKITHLALATLATLGIGGAAFCAIFFTTTLLAPSIAVSVSIVVLISGADIALVICLKNRHNEEESKVDEKIEENQSEEELGSTNKVEETKIEKPIDPDVAFKARLQEHLNENHSVYTEKQLSWLRSQFEQLESPDSKNSPLQDYLYAAGRFPTVYLANQTFGIFNFFFQANVVAANISLETLNEQGIQVEHFVSILTAFIRTSKKSFVMSERQGTSYPLAKLEIIYVPKTRDQEKLQIQFKLNSVVAMQESIKNLF